MAVYDERRTEQWSRLQAQRVGPSGYVLARLDYLREEFRD